MPDPCTPTRGGPSPDQPGPLTPAHPPGRRGAPGHDAQPRPRLLALGLVALVALVGCGGPAAPPPRNVLLVVVDTLRADHLGYAGYSRDTSPELDAWVAQGAVFTQAIAPSPWTRASMASVHTGLLPATARMTSHNFRVPRADGDVLPEAVDTLAEHLSRAGLATTAVVANINVDPVFGFDQGFEEFEVVSAVLGQDDPDWRLGQDLMDDTTDAVTEAALATLSRRAEDGRPFLLYLHYLDPHDPYEPPPPLDRRFDSRGYTVAPDHRAAAARYDGEIRAVSQSLARVRAALEQGGLERDTIVVLVSDHGEEFGEHGGQYHGWTLYDEQLRVPLALVAPGVTRPGQRLDTQVRVLDLLPTLLELLGLPRPPDLQGESLVPVIQGRETGDRPVLSGWGYRPWVSWREPPYKLVLDRETGFVRLFDLEADPAERHDLAQELPRVADRLRAALSRRLEAAEAAVVPGETADDDAVELSGEQLEALRALGYLGGAEDEDG